jgi:CRP-like cAMP-binding protein
MAALLVRKLEIRDDLSAEEIETLHGLVGETVRYDRRASIIKAGEHQSKSRLLLDGWVARAKTLADGQRQITEVHIPGDFVDLHSFLLKRLDHDVIALTPCTIGNVDHRRLKEVSEQHPHLTRMLWLSTLIDASIHREWLTTKGRLPALSQVAHLLCELYVRLECSGLASSHRFPLPLTQEEVADVCGLTSVHVNRVLQELRGRGLIASGPQEIAISDWEGLANVAQFDPIYLNMHKEPR